MASNIEHEGRVCWSIVDPAGSPSLGGRICLSIVNAATRMDHVAALNKQTNRDSMLRDVGVGTVFEAAAEENYDVPNSNFVYVIQNYLKT